MRASQALTLLTLAGVLAVMALSQRSASAAPRRPSQTGPRVADCLAYEVAQQADSVAYEVWRKRGERCRVTLPEGVRRAP